MEEYLNKVKSLGVCLKTVKPHNYTSYAATLRQFLLIVVLLSVKFDGALVFRSPSCCYHKKMVSTQNILN